MAELGYESWMKDFRVVFFQRANSKDQISE